MRTPALRRARVVLAAALAVGLAVPGMTISTARADSASDSSVTVRGSGSFAGLSVSVDRTQQLGHQVVDVSWKGLGQSDTQNQSGPTDYLQIMQCWSDPSLQQVSTDADRDTLRDQCYFGAFGSTYAGNASSVPGGYYASASAYLRKVVKPTLVGFKPGATSDEDKAANARALQAQHDAWALDLHGSQEANDGFVPFKPVSGTAYDGSGNSDVDNPWFDQQITNEIDYAPSAVDGTGSMPFEVQTGLENSSLGCGQARASGVVPKCWIAVVPRGVPTSRTDGAQSPFAWSVWKNAMFIPLDFSSLSSSCARSATKTSITGSPLLAAAASSWTSSLCSSTGRSYSYLSTADLIRESSVTSAKDPGLQAVTRSVPGAPSDTVYAPVAVASLSIVFLIDRYYSDLYFDADGGVQGTPQDQLDHNGELVTQLKLTPRLVAKLLTQSYRGSMPPSRLDVRSADDPQHDDPNLKGARLGLLDDPEFTALNPDLAALDYQHQYSLTNLVVPFGRANEYGELWQWVLADPSARAFLSGQPDEHGMKVNPAFKNALQARDDFPKPDPWCADVDTRPAVPPLCGIDYNKYAANLEAAAIAAAKGDPKRGTFNPVDNFRADFFSGFGSAPRDLVGRRAELVLTDTVSAARFGLRSAQLLNAHGDFVAPDAHSLQAAVDGMDTDDNGVLVPDPSTAVAGAYPLTVPQYVATVPSRITPEEGDAYADLLQYSAFHGQEQGPSVGQLPEGYLPLTQELKSEAVVAAEEIRDEAGVAPDPTSTPTPTPSSTVTRTASPTPAPQSTSRAVTPAPSSSPASTAVAGVAAKPSPSVTADPPASTTVSATTPSAAPTVSTSPTSSATASPSPSHTLATSARPSSPASHPGTPFHPSGGTGSSPVVSGSRATPTPSGKPTSLQSPVPTATATPQPEVQLVSATTPATKVGGIRFALFICLLVALLAGTTSQALRRVPARRR
ncbi:hypothetical protein EV189_0434 [Motilibacter rhizosphaerae]|uniref:PBP domain-containing protein n=1 Tax=Motilibacter rhizosphaerae TaxID=598652 RepID=A0A4Q7NW21_9ACTN|nr:hypothetical protein [Motilibacter rhizosphaerae]RZS91200.1 hypothetical protein EV189_0434 [Motilibacter rhizosphaerae]